MFSCHNPHIDGNYYVMSWIHIKSLLSPNDSVIHDGQLELMPLIAWQKISRLTRKYCRHWKMIHYRRKTQYEAEYIGKAMGKLETCFMTVFRNTILKRTNQTIKMLQSETIDLCTAVALLQSLYQYFAAQRSQEKFAHFFARRKMLCGATGFSEKRLRRSKRTPDDTSDTGIVFNAEDRFRIQTYFPILGPYE